MLHTVSHVLFPYGRQPFIYTFLCSVFASVRLDRLPYQIWVSRLRGLPRSISSFLIIRHFGTFISNQPYRIDLGLSKPLAYATIGYFFPIHKHYHPNWTVRAWTFLYITFEYSVYPDVINYSYLQIQFSLALIFFLTYQH